MLGFHQRQQAAQSQNALRNILGAPGAVDDTGQPTPATMAQVMAVDPAAGMKLQQNALVMQQQKLRTDVMKTDQFGKKLDLLNDSYGPVMQRYQDAIKSGKTPEQAAALAQTDLDSVNQELQQGGMFSPDEQRTHPTKFDPIQMQKFFDGSAVVRDWRKAQLAADQESRTQDRADADLAEKERHNRIVENNDKTMEAGWQVVTDPNAKDADGKSTPVQYRYNARTGQATTLAGDPYTPGGVEKLGTGAPTDDKPMDDRAIAYAGTRYRDTGTLPSFGNSKYAVADRKKIIDWAANRDNKNVDAAGSDIVTQAGVKADVASLAQTTKYRNQVESFEQTAQQSAGLIRSLAPKGLGPTGVPVIDSWMQAGRRAVGNPDVVKFGNAIDTFTSEYAKIMSGATGSAGSTDSARAKAEGLINKAQNAGQLYGALDVMQKEMDIRRKSLTDQEAQIKKELGLAGGKEDTTASEDGGKPQSSAPSGLPPVKADEGAIPTFGASPSDLAAIAKLPKGTRFKGADGKIYVTHAEPTGGAPPPAAAATPASPAQPAAPAVPTPPAGVPAGSAYSPSRKMWRDPSGKIYDAAGKPVASP